MAARLTDTLRDGDTVGRLGGDEFVVLAEGASLAGGLQALADRILDALSPPYELAPDAAPLWASVSIGIAEGPRATPEELLRDADIALYRAKESGKHHAVVFSPEMQQELDDRRDLEADLRVALEGEQFFVRYLPTTDLGTRRASGVEAQLGWHHPELGTIPNATLMAALESTGQIVPVGRWLLSQVCRDGKAWHVSGQLLTVSVGISAAQFAADGFFDGVADVLEASGFDPAYLVIALAESSLGADTPATIGRLLQLKALGVRIALSDFDSGYLSLTFLQRYPIDILKIDRDVVADSADRGETEPLVETLAQLSRVFGVDIMIENPSGQTGERPPAEGIGSPVAAGG
jgi:predicted signal transduction protein with EAL and GGDEF domain